MRKLIFSLSGIFILILLVGSLFVSFQGCNKDEITSPTSNNNIGYSQTGTGCSELDPMVTPIYAGQTIPVGNLKVWNSTDKLFIKYQFNTGYTANTLHLWVGCNLDLVPLAGGKTPIPGQFPYKFELNGGSQYTFEIPLTAISDCGTGFGCPNSPAEIFILAHAEVTGNVTETGWSYIGNTDCGEPFEEKWPETTRWGWVTCYKYCCEPEEPGGPSEFYSETAFAKPSKAPSAGSLGGYVFAWDNKANPESYQSWELAKNRWGWGGKFDISTSIFPMNFPLWAGCGLNNTNNGVNIGYVTLTKDANNLYITYTAYSGYTISEVHIYLGDTKPETIAPGQCGFTMTYDPPVTTKTYNFDLPSGDFYFIGHAVAQLPIP